jgi:hypothetical protein
LWKTWLAAALNEKNQVRLGFTEVISGTHEAALKKAGADGTMLKIF